MHNCCRLFARQRNQIRHTTNSTSTKTTKKMTEPSNKWKIVYTSIRSTVAMFAMAMRYCVKRELFNEKISTKLIQRDLCVDGLRRCASKRNKCSKKWMWMCLGSACTWMCLNETLIRVSQSALNEERENEKKYGFTWKCCSHRFKPCWPPMPWPQQQKYDN